MKPRNSPRMSRARGPSIGSASSIFIFLVCVLCLSQAWRGSRRRRFRSCIWTTGSRPTVQVVSDPRPSTSKCLRRYSEKLKSLILYSLPRAILDGGPGQACSGISDCGPAAVNRSGSFSESLELKQHEKLTGADWALFGLALLLLVPPVVVIVLLNDGSVSSFFTSADGRSYFLSYCSFWLAAMAGLTAGRGVVRHQRGTPKADLATASVQDYIECAMLLVSSACALALTAHDEPLPHRTFLNLLTAYPIVYAGYLVVLKIWEKQRLKRKKAVPLASVGLRNARWSFLAVSSAAAIALWAMDWFFL